MEWSLKGRVGHKQAVKGVKCDNTDERNNLPDRGRVGCNSVRSTAHFPESLFMERNTEGGREGEGERK